MNNAVRKTNREYIAPYTEINEIREKRSKNIKYNLHVKFLLKMSLGCMMILFLSIVTTSLVAKKMELKMEISSLKKEARELEKKVDQFRSDNNLAMNLEKLEEKAKKNLGMQIATEIVYISK